MIDRAQLSAWMAAAAEGDRTVLEPLFATLSSASIRYAERMVGERALAEDCVQDALVELFAQLDRYDPERDALTWALTLVTWSCRSARRHRARAAARIGNAEESVADGQLLAEERDLIRAALAALGSLPRADLETIGAHIAADRDHGLPPATFRKRVERALSRLRNAWRARHGSI